jgi:hypothetical protein
MIPQVIIQQHEYDHKCTVRACVCGFFVMGGWWRPLQPIESSNDQCTTRRGQQELTLQNDMVLGLYIYTMLSRHVACISRMKKYRVPAPLDKSNSWKVLRTEPNVDLISIIGFRRSSFTPVI